MTWIHYKCRELLSGVAMDEFIRKVYERGKITIPKELRDLYGVKDGDMVRLRIVDVVDAAERMRRGAPARSDNPDSFDFEVEAA